MLNPYERARPFCDWHEDIGDVLWWRIPVEEPPYFGSPLCLGRGMKVEIYIGREQFDFPVQQTGGWPFDEEDERHLWWTPVPSGNVINDQVPL